MAYTKQTWVDGSSGGTPINATRLNHMEDGIEQSSYSSAYSTTEIDTKNTWIDGKPIYRRIFTGTKVSGTDFDIMTGITTVDKLIKLDGTIDTPSGYQYPINQYESSTIWHVANFYKSTGRLRVSSSTGNYSNGDIIVIMEYTKTTD